MPPWVPDVGFLAADLARHARWALDLEEREVPLPAPVPERSGAPGLRGAEGLAAVRADLGDCRRCQLCSGRKQIVFGVGNPRAEVVFVGEGPGADEDEQGEPFVGKA